MISENNHPPTHGFLWSVCSWLTFLWVTLGGPMVVMAGASDVAPPRKLSADFERILIAGNGPERYLLEILASEFEERYPTISVDFFWHPNAKPVRTIELHEADIGVTGEEAPPLRSVKIARDGIAVITNFSNPIKEMTIQQVADVFSGKIRYWSEVNEEAPQTKIVLINRTHNQNIIPGFEKTLNIPNGIPRSVQRAESEEQAIKLVSGDLNAVTFVSMAPALRAKEDGIAVNLVFINKVEPEVQTVLDKRYPLQRPVILITDPDPSPQVKLFEQFVLSPEGQALLSKGKFYPLKDK